MNVKDLEWRVGDNYCIHVYAITAKNDKDIPVCTALTAELARRIVEDHNQALFV